MSVSITYTNKNTNINGYLKYVKFKFLVSVGKLHGSPPLFPQVTNKNTTNLLLIFSTLYNIY